MALQVRWAVLLHAGLFLSTFDSQHSRIPNHIFPIQIHAARPALHIALLTINVPSLTRELQN